VKYWFDTEFIEDGRTIELLSIGIVAEDGREFYAEVWDADIRKADAWVKANVFPYLVHLTHGKHVSWDDFPSCPAVRKSQLGALIHEFCAPERHGKPEFWAYYADYDWVALCQLFGRMIDLPEGFPKFCMDIKQWAVMVGNPPLPKQESDEHHALADARWNRRTWFHLEELS
jgi:hypothetical protein